MKFSVRFNNDRPVQEYIALAQAAERAGFDQFWVSDDLFLRSATVILDGRRSDSRDSRSCAILCSRENGKFGSVQICAMTGSLKTLEKMRPLCCSVQAPCNLCSVGTS